MAGMNKLKFHDYHVYYFYSSDQYSNMLFCIIYFQFQSITVSSICLNFLQTESNGKIPYA